MAVIKTIEKGESLTFGFVLPETYNLDNLQAVKIYIGSSIYEHKMDGRTVRVELESNQTALITGRNIVHFVIDDAVFGIKKLNCGELEVLPTQATHKDESINTGYDVEIVLSINVETVSIGSVLYDTLKGDKGDAGTIEVGTVTTGDAGTDVIVENVGTQSEAVLNFTIPKGSSGDFFSGDYNLIINKQDAKWVDGWLWIDTGEKTYNKKIDVGYMAISTGIGTEQLKPIVHYPAGLTYEFTSIPNGFYLKDEDGRLSENVDFEFIDVRYNISNDTGYKYDGLTKLIGGNAAFDDFDVSHSAAMRTIFLQIYEGFTGEVYRAATDILCNNTRIDAHFEPTYARIRNLDIIGIPITNGASTEQSGSNPDILKISSHYNNTFARKDITANETTFLNDVIAVGSCPDMESPTTGTSFGYGVEFFEDTSRTAQEYPNFGSYGNSQSASTAIITAKFKIIKDATGVSWSIVRKAARATARKTVGGVYAAGFPWDMYRGFGVIDVDGAIQWIKDSYTENEDYLNNLADEVERTRGIDPMLPYEKQTDDTPIAKRDFEPVRDKLAGIEDNANKYVHPATHPPAIIEQDANNRFVTDMEKSAWDGKQNALGFTPENDANKQNSLAADGTGAKYPTVDAVNAALSLKADNIDLVEAKQSISTLENVLSDANINQEAQVTASGVDTVSLPKTAANTGMQVQLFGQSAENLVNGANIAPAASVTFPTILNNKYYVSNQVALVTGDGNNYTSTNSGATAINIVVVDLTATFGAGNEPTKEQCDLLFANYFEGSDNVLGTGRIRSVNSAGLLPSYLYFNGGQLRSNGLIKDEIRKGTNWYELVKRVGVGINIIAGSEKINNGNFEAGLIGILDNGLGGATVTYSLNTSNPISGVQDGRLVVSAAGANGMRPFVYFESTSFGGNVWRKFSFKYKVNSGVCVLRAVPSSDYTINVTLTGSGTATVYFKDNRINKFIYVYFDGRNIFDVQIDDISIVDISFNEGDIVNGYFTLNNINTYPLATPIITPIAHAGLLNSNSNGTAYFEPIIADAGVYSSSLAIQLTDYPIASFESIRKYANGTYTDLNPATAVIASGGLSFTHPDLVSGDLVMFTYAYNKESIGRSMTLTHYDNRYVKVDTANGKTYRIDFVVTNGVVVPTATEV